MEGIETVNVCLTTFVVLVFGMQLRLERVNLASAAFICHVNLTQSKHQYGRNLLFETATKQMISHIHCLVCLCNQSAEKPANKLIGAKTNRSCWHELIIQITCYLQFS